MAQIQIATHPKKAIVDDEDYFKCAQIIWRWSGTIIYNENVGSMGKFLLNTKKMVDHKDLDPFNNRKENLREANQSLNSANKLAPINNTSGYKGVFYRKNRKHWYACITVNYKQNYLGAFRSKEEAIRVYDEAAVKYFGEFAKTNRTIAAGGY